MTRDELLYYYERELAFIRRSASGFAEKYPEVAGRLMLEANKASEDPHVERIIESFAMLSARIQMRLNDDFAEVTDALLQILYPHYLSPVPSLTIVQFDVDADAAQGGEGIAIERHSVLHSRPVDGVRCRFRTAYPVTLWPVRVQATELVTTTALGVPVPSEARSALRIRLETLGDVSFADLPIDRLRFFLDAGSGSIHQLYELFLRNPQGIALQRGAGTPATLLPPEAIQPVGFARNEGLLEYPDESFMGYRHLQEYFAFPDKFLFVDLRLDGATARLDGQQLDLSVLLSESMAEFDLRVSPDNLKLGCTPAVNLFPHQADPIRLTHTSVEYPVVPDARSPRAYEVHSLRAVSSTAPGTAQARDYQPFYTLRHGVSAPGEDAYYSVSRRPSIRKDDPGTDVFLTLVDEKFHPLTPPTEVLNVEALCTNRDLPSRLPFGNAQGDFMLEGRAGISRITCLRNPSPPLRAPAGQGSRWRLISHLALNYLSLSDDAPAGPGGKSRALDALREILKLYDFQDSPVTRQRIAGLVDLRTRRIVRRIGSGSQGGFARGVEAELEFDPGQYTGSGLFLFASVLEAFLGLYASINSFIQTVARVRQRQGALKRWPPRAGEIQLL